MRIVQLTPTISYGDAVSNEIFMLSGVMDRMCIDNTIVAIDKADKVKEKVIKSEHFIARANDIFIYHMSIGSKLSEYVIKADVMKKGMIYHNITPAKYFEGVSNLADACRMGRNQLNDMSGIMDFSFSDSGYNMKELIDLGYRNCHVLPFVFNKEEYINNEPDQDIMERFGSDGYVNILFTGRIAPNKKQQDVILSYHFYHKYINPKSRLILAGGVVATEKYMNFLNNFVKQNNIENVIFTGHIPFNQIIAYYKTADLFLCESEHEGFCVPLLEAMTFGIPILAYSAAAIPDTMGNSGVLFCEKNHMETAECMNMILTDSQIRQKIVDGQYRRLEDFSADRIEKLFNNLITKYTEGIS